MKEDVQLIWQTGKPYYEQAVKRAAAYNSKVKVFDFIREMDYAYMAADIVVSRAGALAIGGIVYSRQASNICAVSVRCRRPPGKQCYGACIA